MNYSPNKTKQHRTTGEEPSYWERILNSGYGHDYIHTFKIILLVTICFVNAHSA
jgi:hypothetical protein